MPLKIPNLSLVLLIGASGSGKSSFARKHFKPSEVLSSDTARGWVADDENSLEATPDAFAAVHFIAEKRLARGLLTVIDATNVQPEARRLLIELARKYHVLPAAIVLDVPQSVCRKRNTLRPDRQFGSHVVNNQTRDLRRSLKFLKREGLRSVFVLNSEEIESVSIERTRLWNDRREDSGPFDIIGDVHGCAHELHELLQVLGYARDESGVWKHRERRVIFLGDLVDRGPDSPQVLEDAMAMCAAGAALCVPGNHDAKLLDKLRGRNVKIAHGLAETLEQLEARDEGFRERAASFIDGLVSHYVLDGGNLVVAHAGLKASMQGRASGAVRAFYLYGETTGESDEWGLPVRYPWARDYKGHARVVYGHTPVARSEWLNNTLDIDTGCVFGGRLSALRYPELEQVSVQSRREYAPSARPIFDEPSDESDVLDLEDVLGRRRIETRFGPPVAVREENALGALEVMSRFACDPRWLIYLPSTMSPVETARSGEYLEHPAQAWAYFQQQGVQFVVCEEKHMGSRAVVIVCRDEQSARERFGVEGESGVIYTRTGRRFFEDREREAALLQIVRDSLSRSHFWDEFETSWVCLDAELMPWSAKATSLLHDQYAPVGAAGTHGLQVLEQVLGSSNPAVGEEIAVWHTEATQRHRDLQSYTRAYERYCWEVSGVGDLKLAPFHLLAAEGKTFFDRSHLWHMEAIAKVYEADDSQVLVATPHRVVELADEEAVQAATQWWLDLTASGGEGMVVKPLDFIPSRPQKPEVQDEDAPEAEPAPRRKPNEERWTQPAIKVRGREYLRLIYGPEYTRPENIERLRARALGSKRGLALREWGLGLESLERFVSREPLRRVHECAFAVLALESSPVDPRL